MDNWQEAAQFRDDLVNDLRTWYDFVPNRKMDIIWMMRHYLHEAEWDDRPEVLDGIIEDIGKWLRNEAYPDPTEWQHQFDCAAASNELEHILDSYLSGIAAAENPDALADACKKDVRELDEKYGGYIIDTWRRETLYELLDGTVELARMENTRQEPDLADPGGLEMGGM